MRRGAAPGAAVVAAVSAIALTVVAVNNGSHDVVAGQGLAIVIWTVIAAGWISGWLPRAPVPPGLQATLAGCALLCVVCAASLAWTESDARTLVDLARDTLYLGVIVLTASVIDRRSAPWAVFGCLLAGSVVLLVAMSSRLAPSLFPVDDTGRIFETPRLSYPLNYWNAVGALAALTLGLGVAWAAHVRSAAVRFAGLAVLPLGAGVIFLTYSRAAIGGLAIAVCLLVVFARHRVTIAHQLAAGGAIGALTVLLIRHHREIADARGTDGALVIAAFLVVAAVVAGVVATSTHVLDDWRVPTRIARRALTAAGVAALLAGAIVGPGLASEAWSQFSKPSSTDTTDPVARLGTLSGYRYELFDSALRAFKEHPFKGTGSGTFEFWFSRDGGAPRVRDGHSLLLEPMAELGMLGLLATLALLGGAAYAVAGARRRAQSPTEVAAALGGIVLLGVWVAQGSVDWLWEVPGVTALALFGVAAAAMVAAEQRTWRPGIAARAAVAVLALVVIAVQLPGISSTRHLRASERAGKAGNIALARAEAEAAVDAEPWNSETWSQLGVIEEAAGRHARALANLSRAQELEPTNWRWPYLRARVFASMGRSDDALTALRRARDLRPASPFLNAAPQ